MNLKEYNRINIFKGRKDSKPFITMQQRNGVFTISKEASKVIGIENGGMVQLVQDEEEPTSWYIEKVAKDGFNVRVYRNDHSLCFNCAALVRAILASCGGEEMYNRCPIGEPVKVGKRTLWTIVTAAIK